MIFADQGSAWYITGGSDSRWDDNDLNQLKAIPGSMFEAVQNPNTVVRGWNPTQPITCAKNGKSANTNPTWTPGATATYCAQTPITPVSSGNVPKKNVAAALMSSPNALLIAMVMCIVCNLV